MARRSLSVPATVERLAEVRTFVRDATTALGASRRAAADLAQAVDEAACNVILHGYRGRRGDLEIEAEARAGAVRVRIRDRAPAFDPTAARAPDLGVPPLARRPGGMGIHLLTTMVDEVHHRARPGGGNELVLVRRLKPVDGRDDRGLVRTPEEG